jgi:hypothetical protein
VGAPSQSSSSSPVAPAWSSKTDPTFVAPEAHTSERDELPRSVTVSTADDGLRAGKYGLLARCKRAFAEKGAFDRRLVSADASRSQSIRDRAKELECVDKALAIGVNVEWAVIGRRLPIDEDLLQ